MIPSTSAGNSIPYIPAASTATNDVLKPLNQPFIPWQSAADNELCSRYKASLGTAQVWLSAAQEAWDEWNADYISEVFFGNSNVRLDSKLEQLYEALIMFLTDAGRIVADDSDVLKLKSGSEIAPEALCDAEDKIIWISRQQKLDGDDARARIMLHELSHVIDTTDDAYCGLTSRSGHAFAITPLVELAYDDPEKAQNNADSLVTLIIVLKDLHDQGPGSTMQQKIIELSRIASREERIKQADSVMFGVNGDIFDKFTGEPA